MLGSYFLVCSQFFGKRVITNMTQGIYLISGAAYLPTNLGDNGYFGQSKDILARWKTHKSQLSNNNHPNQHLQNYVNKYGLESLSFSVIEEVSVGGLDAAEKKIISRDETFKNPKGFNRTVGGSDGAGLANSRPYALQHKDSDEIIIGENLNDFCRLHPELNRDCMYRVKNDKQKSHKGWFNPELTKREMIK